MSHHERRVMIDRDHPKVSVVRQCELLDISRSSVYYSPVQIGEYELELMELIDRQYLQAPFYGSRKMTALLRRQGNQVNRKRVQRLMRRMSIEAIYRRPKTPTPASGNKLYPYLLRCLQFDRANQVWAAHQDAKPWVCPAELWRKRQFHWLVSRVTGNVPRTDENDEHKGEVIQLATDLERLEDTAREERAELKLLLTISEVAFRLGLGRSFV